MPAAFETVYYRSQQVANTNHSSVLTDGQHLGSKHGVISGDGFYGNTDIPLQSKSSERSLYYIIL